MIDKTKCKNKNGISEQIVLRNPSTKKLHWCSCGCNVFAPLTLTYENFEVYECNRCQTLWIAGDHKSEGVEDGNK